MNPHAVELSAANRPELLPEENLLFVQDGVGLYEGKTKLPEHQNGHVYLTSHRVCYVDNAYPRRKSLAIPLKIVDRVEHYAGFLKSSAKVSLFPKHAQQISLPALGQRSSSLSLSRTPPRANTSSPFRRNGSPIGSQSSSGTSTARSSTWICPICSFSNILPAGFDPTVVSEQTPLPLCQTCGIKPPLAHLLKAAISNASSRGSTESSRGPSHTENPQTKRSLLGIATRPEVRFAERPSNICPRCTFENYPSLQSCEMCGLSMISDYDMCSENHLTYNQPDSPGLEATQPYIDDTPSCVRLSFRTGGDKIFHERVKGALIQRKWLSDHAPPVPLPQAGIGGSQPASNRGTPTPEPKAVGIAGLEQRGLDRRRNNEATISTAFEDLEALMASAQDIIGLAESLTDRSSSTSATELIRDAANNMATTKDMLANGTSTSDSLYLSELSRELAEYLTNERAGVLRRSGGIMSLVDLWAEFNDLRNGVELISPSDFEKAVRLWEKLTLPVRLRTFRNGLLVVQHYDQTDDKTITQILAWMQELHETRQSNLQSLDPTGDIAAFGIGITARDAATRFGWSVGVAGEELEMAEERGVLCREEGIEGLKFWENWIMENQCFTAR